MSRVGLGALSSKFLQWPSFPLSSPPSPSPTFLQQLFSPPSPLLTFLQRLFFLPSPSLVRAHTPIGPYMHNQYLNSQCYYNNRY